MILTHDVEGPEGLAKCRRLAELEMELGFRSSFNFVPEGRYTVQPELRAWMNEHGFEVGVHDLKHDGKLFASRGGFLKRADRINRHLHDWHATGFRSAFMLRNLDWIHELDVEYDSSTFDTDPFEPQSNGARTIFPFWMSPFTRSAERKSSSAFNSLSFAADAAKDGYVELPYTLPQDSTLFLLLRETSSDIWIRKADWIAAHSGMVLLNVHPDYIRFDGDALSARTYPVAHYVALLKHLRDQHVGSFWQPLASVASRSVAQMKPRPVLHPRKLAGLLTDMYLKPRRRPARQDRKAGASAPGCTITWLETDEDESWDRFVGQHPAGSICQTTHWRDVLEESFPHMDGRFLALRDDKNGAIVAGLAVYAVRSWMLGDRLVSVPFASCVGPVATEPGHVGALVEYLEDYRQQANLRWLEVRLNRTPAAALSKGGIETRSFKHNYLPLATDTGALFKKFSRSCVRSCIQKSDREEVKLRMGGSPADWDAFYHLHMDTRRRLGLPVMPRRFFSAMARHLPPASLFMHVAEKNGRILAVGLSLVFNGTWQLEWVGDSPDGREVGAGQRLYWTAIQEAAARGFHTFSFGRTAATNAGLLAYKRHWGTTEEDIPIYYWGRYPGRGATPERRSRHLAQRVINSSPKPLYLKLSDFCYRHLG